MTTKNQPIETETEATHGAHLFRSLFVHAFELMDQVQRYQDCQAGDHPGYADMILTRQYRAPLDPDWRARCDSWLRRERARRAVDPAGLRRTYGKGGESCLAAIGAKLGALAIIAMLFVGCAGGEVAEDQPVGATPAQACEVTPVSTISGCTTNLIPLRPATPDITAMTVYWDSEALAPSEWEATSDGHFIIVHRCDPSRPRLISVSFGCVATDLDCNASHGCAAKGGV